MRKFAIVSIVILLAASVAGSAFAGSKSPVTLEGKVVCAKCSLHAEGQDKCQNVLVVEKKGKEKLYYMAKTDAGDRFGEVCTGSPMVRVTGTVNKEDGKLWIAPTEIASVEKG